METIDILSLIVGALVGIGGSVLLSQRGQKDKEAAVREKARKLLLEAKSESESLRREAKSHLQEIKRNAQEENVRREEHLKRLEESIALKERHVQGREDKNKNLEDAVKATQGEIQKFEKNREEEAHQMVETLLKKTSTTKEEALDDARQSLHREILSRKDKYVQHRLVEAEEDSLKTAQNVLVSAIQKYADTSSVDHTETAVIVKNERFKPAFIGEKGELIEYFESLIDVEVIFNDYPKTITIGGYNILKRQTAREAVDLLQTYNGTITKAVIDEAMKKADKAVTDLMVKNAKLACTKIGLKDVPEGLLRYIGRLHFRTSYGQNALKHCLEVGFFAGLIAAEIGADVELARIAGFFHDVGKATSEESDKGHDYLTKEILEEFGYPENIVHAAWVHHEAEPAKTLEAKIVMAADALSASRPGARLESLERYLQRIRDLEGAANSFAGVKKTFAISAGREVRVLVRPEEITDEQMHELAHNIAQKIEDNLTYPGNVKVNVIRRRQWEAFAAGHPGHPNAADYVPRPEPRAPRKKK